MLEHWSPKEKLDLTDDEPDDLPGDGGAPDVVHGLDDGPVVAVGEVGVDAVGQQHPDHVRLAAERGLVQRRAAGGPHVDVEAGREDQGHHLAG